MDYMVRAINDKKTFRLFMVKSTNTVESARKFHNTSPVASAALGRTLTAGLMMGYMMKNDDDKITVRINGGGPIGTILAVADNKGNIKGYVDNPNVEVKDKDNGKLNVGEAVGIDGKVTVIKDMGMKEPYVGTSDMVTGEIAEDLTMYYWLSEQQNSAVALGVLVNTDLSVKSAGGFIVQTLPFIEDEEVKAIEETLKNMKSISEYFDTDKDVEDIAREMFQEFNMKITDKIPVQFNCDCSKERMEEALISIGKEELKEIAKEDEKIEIVCHFCNKKYLFENESLQHLIDMVESGS